MLLQVYYGQDDNVNTLPYLVGCVFIYLAYKWLKSVNNSSGKVEETAKKAAISGGFVATDKKVGEPEISTQTQAIADNKITYSKLQTATEDSKLKLKGAFAAILAKNEVAETKGTTAFEDDESEIV